MALSIIIKSDGKILLPEIPVILEYIYTLSSAGIVILLFVRKNVELALSITHGAVVLEKLLMFIKKG